MADEEPTQPQSIQERIAALKLSQVGKTPEHPPPSYNAATKGAIAAKARPPPPPRPDLPSRPVSTNNPPVTDHAPASNGRSIGNQPEAPPRPTGAVAYGMDGTSRPALPPRTSTQSSQGPTLPPRKPSEQSPALPPRRPSNMTLSRRESDESISSINTTSSSVSARSNGTSITSRSDRFAIRAPEFDPSALPPLPPKRTQEEKDAQTKKDAAKRPPSTSSRYLNGALRKPSNPSVPARPQPRPTPSFQARTQARQDEPPLAIEASKTPAAEQPALPVRQTVAPPPRKSALAMGFGNKEVERPPVPAARPGSVQATDDAPPPVPTGSRPGLAALQASKPKVNGTINNAAAPSGGQGSCLHCRDFSGPDNHAARFPRESIPSQDLGWLSHQLTSPFASATDKARCIFTWLHHNIAYDVVSFFGSGPKPSTPASTLSSGLAVCEGYASLFTALAMKAGLESVVIGGHGKGYGHTKLKPGERVPPYSAGHAWNAVRIDNGEWKLIDPCWGAGVVQGPGQPYQKRFAPERFTQSNEEFGLSHYPEDNRRQYRADGRVVSWEEYILGNKSGTQAQMFNGYVAEEGMWEPSFKPAANPIVLAEQGPTVRFSFQKICPHWDPVRCGKGPYYLYVLHLEGLDGTQRNHIPFESRDGVWWCDVPVRDLGRPGQKATICTVSEFEGRDGRGLTAQKYKENKGRVAMMFAWVGTWEVA